MEKVKQSLKVLFGGVARGRKLRRLDICLFWTYRMGGAGSGLFGAARGEFMSSHGKAVAGVSARRTYGTAARCVLQGGLKDVWHWLPLAASSCGEADEENVHQLRVSTRRTDVAVRAFSDVIGKKPAKALREKLKKIRKAADAARNIDVNQECFQQRAASAPEHVRVKYAEMFRLERAAAHEPIVAIFREFEEAHFDQQFLAIVQDMRAHQKLARRRFGTQAHAILKPVLKRFFKAAVGDISNSDALHQIRIQAKKLRYTMEIVASAFGPDFSGKLYREFTGYQDLTGAIRDHSMAIDMYRGWLAQASDMEEQAFLEEGLRSESAAHDTLNKAFAEMWTKDRVENLKRKFKELTSRKK